MRRAHPQWLARCAWVLAVAMAVWAAGLTVMRAHSPAWLPGTAHAVTQAAADVALLSAARDAQESPSSIADRLLCEGTGMVPVQLDLGIDHQGGSVDPIESVHLAHGRPVFQVVEAGGPPRGGFSRSAAGFHCPPLRPPRLV